MFNRDTRVYDVGDLHGSHFKKKGPVMMKLSTWSFGLSLVAIQNRICPVGN